MTAAVEGRLRFTLLVPFTFSSLELVLDENLKPRTTGPCLPGLPKDRSSYQEITKGSQGVWATRCVLFQALSIRHWENRDPYFTDKETGALKDKICRLTQLARFQVFLKSKSLLCASHSWCREKVNHNVGLEESGNQRRHPWKKVSISNIKQEEMGERGEGSPGLWCLSRIAR